MLSFVIRGHQRDTGRGRGISSSFYCALRCLSVVEGNQAQELHRGTHLPLSFSSTRMGGFLMSSAGILASLQWVSQVPSCEIKYSHDFMCVCVYILHIKHFHNSKIIIIKQNILVKSHLCPLPFSLASNFLLSFLQFKKMKAKIFTFPFLKKVAHIWTILYFAFFPTQEHILKVTS